MLLQDSNNKRIWFSIGSVDAFERNLGVAQTELNLDPSNFVSVAYKTEIDG